MTAIALTALIKQPNLGWPLASFMVAIIFFMGATTMWLIGKQAALDAAVRGFAMVGKVAGMAGTAIKKIQPSPDEGLPDQ